MNKDELKQALEEGVEKISNRGADAMSDVNSAACEGLMDAVGRADGQLTNFQLVLPIARAVFEVLEQECEMSEDEVAAVFQLMCEANKEPLTL